MKSMLLTLLAPLLVHPGVAAAQTPAAGGAAPGPVPVPRSSDFGVVKTETTVAAPIDKVWGFAGPFCAIAIWSPDHAPCTPDGPDDIGGMRHLPPRGVNELMVAKTRYSYTYVQPQEDLLYHGTLAAEPIDAGHTRLIFTAIYDQRRFLTAQARAAEHKRRTDRWVFQLGNIKRMAEALR